MMMMNIEGEGIDDIRAYFRKKLVSMGVIKPTQEEQAEMQQAAQAQAQQPPSPEQQRIMAEVDEKNAGTMERQAKVVKLTADAELAKAQAMQILADIKAGNIDQAFRAIEALQNNALTQSQVQKNNASALSTHVGTAQTLAAPPANNPASPPNVGS